jgi:YHS domain-containing protein
LVRLGIDIISAPLLPFEGVDYRFCCQGCATEFAAAPAKYLSEIEDIVVCPTCLAEKNRGATVALEYQGQKIYFCRCPHCREEFLANPDSLLRRLAS